MQIQKLTAAGHNQAAMDRNGNLRVEIKCHTGWDNKLFIHSSGYRFNIHLHGIMATLA